MKISRTTEEKPRVSGDQLPWLRFVILAGVLNPMLTSRIFLWLFGAGSLASICLLVQHYPRLTGTTGELIYASFTVFLLFCLTFYIYLLHSRKLHRYSRAVLHFHFVNHTIRDALGELKQHFLEGKLDDETLECIISTQVTEVLTSVSNCFSLVTGHSCAVCLKELYYDDSSCLSLKTVARDIISSASRLNRDIAKNKSGQPLNHNTPCNSLLKGEANEGRYYLENDLLSAWKRGEYDNIAFKKSEPKILSVFPGISKIIWPLPYRSVLVTPVRFSSATLPPLFGDGKGNAPDAEYWGFLCIDSPARECFDLRLAPELAAAFADILHVLLSQSELFDRLTIINSTPHNETFKRVQ